MSPKHFYFKSIIFFTFISIFNFTTPSHGDDSTSLVLATGEKGTSYYRFSVLLAEELSRILGTGMKISVTPTQGSVEGLNLIAKNKADFAIAQSDIAFHAHRGKNLFQLNRSFKMVYPLFLEHVWIISKPGSDFKIFNDLKNKTIALGGEGSGSRYNAIDILSTCGLEEGVDFLGSFLSLEASFIGLNDGSIDAMFYTGKSIPDQIKRAPSEYTFHGIGDRLASQIVKKNPYYKKSVVDTPGGSIQTISVQALLVGGNKLSKTKIEGAVQSIINLSSELNKRGFELDPLGEAIKRRPIPLNRYARELLENLGYIKVKDKIHFVFFIILGIVIFVMYSGRTVKSYDSSGEPVAESNSLTQKIVYFGAKGEAFIYTVLVFITLLLLDVLLIQYFEKKFIEEVGGIAKFTDLTLFEGAVNLFLYTASGYTTETFPVSHIGQIMAALLPLIGVATIGAIFLIFIEKNRAMIKRREMGLARLRLENHTVICGWNEAAPALIYNLTSSYAPKRMRVVVVTNFETDRPFINEDFDKNYVHYCKGIGTSAHSIENASIETAHSVIVLADRTDKKNRKGLMTVLVAGNKARKNTSRKKDLFISSELQLPENKNLLMSLGANAIVDSGLIKNKLSSLACISPRSIELFINLLSYDTGVEIYSMPTSNLNLPSNISWGTLKTQLAEKNINLLGVKGTHREKLSKETDWENGLSGTLLDFDQNITKDSVTIYAANDYDDILKFKISQIKWNEALKSKENTTEVKKNVLLVGSYTRCSETRDFLTTEFPLLFKDIKILTEEFKNADAGSFVFCGSLSDKSLWESTCVHDMDIVLILFDPGDEYDKFSVDAKSISTTAFASRLINSNDKNKSGRPTLISEIYNFENENLFLSAGSNVLIPVNRLIALMLSKTIYSKGVVCDFISSLIDGNSDMRMKEISVKKNDCFFGKTFIELILKPWDNFTVLAWLSYKKGLNMVIVPEDCGNEELIEEGDVIIGILKK